MEGAGAQVRATGCEGAEVGGEEGVEGVRVACGGEIGGDAEVFEMNEAPGGWECGEEAGRVGDEGMVEEVGGVEEGEGFGVDDFAGCEDCDGGSGARCLGGKSGVGRAAEGVAAGELEEESVDGDADFWRECEEVDCTLCRCGWRGSRMVAQEPAVRGPLLDERFLRHFVQSEEEVG